MDDRELNARFEVLSQNQNIINEKINSILDLFGRQYNDISEIKNENRNQQALLNAMIYDISMIKAKFSDLEVQIQNSDGNMVDINNSLSNLSYQIDELKQLINEWKIYSDI